MYIEEVKKYVLSRPLEFVNGQDNNDGSPSEGTMRL